MPPIADIWLKLKPFYLKNTCENFTKFSPKRGSRNYKKNYANITFFDNNKFWTEQEIQRNQNIFNR